MARQGPTTTSFALLGLLSFGDGLTGYELKQRADATLRFYWVAPAMSQVYTELARLSRLGYVVGRADPAGGPIRYRMTADGDAELRRWLADTPVEFPALKHPVALRLLIGGLLGRDQVVALLADYLDALADRRADLQGVHDGLESTRGAEADPFLYPRMVAEWGLHYYDSERVIVERLLANLPAPPSHFPA